MARKFLYVVAILIVLAIASAFAYRIWGQQLINATMVPSRAFRAPEPLGQDAYGRSDHWIARPDIAQGNPALWRPAGTRDGAVPQPAAIFFVHPTSYLATANLAQWNAPLNDADSRTMAARFVAGQASAFNGIGAIWAPRYRQAHFGAFLTEKPEGQRAINAAYGDVARAFETFLAANPDGPIVLAGHSQGSLHLLRLLKDKVAGTPLAQRIVAAYVIGWPVSLEADVPALGLPACTAKGQSGCILSWQSFAEPADPSAIQRVYDGGQGYTGKPRMGTRMLCINPLTGKPDSAAAASLNLGTLDGRADEENPVLVPRAVPARCGKDGFLLIGDPPDLGPYALPGNNYHVYDYALFWANIRVDARERLLSFLKER
ncbi:DUF3089 domain-containing protein [Sphingobium algorifonticola]|uniref:DUF3089 domain-containing protein n=1 Tax=Sphingobium algorifonticola TaxID=2008318 RepID=A0A437J515_9SPHN|nr:DUF3089 domain-containing protein [Sphingobium algorifonticola]RVT39828.1 DUF3089 domain-containing protein [Sphingobium algorifonticola]